MEIMWLGRWGWDPQRATTRRLVGWLAQTQSSIRFSTFVVERRRVSQVPCVIVSLCCHSIRVSSCYSKVASGSSPTRTERAYTVHSRCGVVDHGNIANAAAACKKVGKFHRKHHSFWINPEALDKLQQQPKGLSDSVVVRKVWNWLIPVDEAFLVNDLKSEEDQKCSSGSCLVGHMFLEWMGGSR